MRLAGSVTRARDAKGDTFYEVAASSVMLHPQAKAVPTGAVVFFGILEWREATPTLRVHYVVPAAAPVPSGLVSLTDWKFVGAALRHARDAVRHLLMRAATRGRANSLTLEIEATP